MDYTGLKFWLDLLEFIAVSGISLYLYISRKHQVTVDRLEAFRDEVDRRLEAHGNRLTRVEESISHGPTHDDVAHVHRRLDDVGQKLADLAGEFRAVRRTLELISQHMLDRH